MSVASASLRPAPSLAGDFAMALDPVLFARSVGKAPDPWQAEVLLSTSRRVLLNCSRQSGKSTVSAVTALHEALYRPDRLILLFSPSLRQSSELFRTLAGLYTRTGAVVPPKAETQLRLELANGSRIISLPASEATVRGYAGVHTIIIDEAARVEDELYEAVLPMLATTNGRVVALSTPFGKLGWWAEAWRSGGDLWERYEVPASQCPRISPAFLEEQRRTRGEWFFRQEYGCEFVDGVNNVFNSEDVERVFSGKVETWNLFGD